MPSFIRFLPGIILVAFYTTSSLLSAQTVTIGSQTWMAKNLEVATFRNGDSIINTFNNNRVSRIVKKKKQPAFSFCESPDMDDEDTPLGPNYGFTYNWYAVSDPRGLCPADWHVPTEHDWKILTNYLDPKADTTNCCLNNAGGMMKSTGTWNEGTGLWFMPNKAASNSSGFNGLPNQYVYGMGHMSYWWCLDPHPRRPSYAKIGLLSQTSAVFGLGFGRKSGYFGIRCLKD